MEYIYVYIKWKLISDVRGMETDVILWKNIWGNFVVTWKTNHAPTEVALLKRLVEKRMD